MDITDKELQILSDTTGVRRVLYLDLDGTVRKGKDELGRFVNGPEDVEIFPEALEQMHKFKDAGWRIIGVTNQGGVALGIMTMQAMAEGIQRTNQLCDELFDRITSCIHHPHAKNPMLASCWCRKPMIGGLVQAATDLAQQHRELYPPFIGLFVGDRPEDVGCAQNANLPFMWAKDWRAGFFDPTKMPI